MTLKLDPTSISEDGGGESTVTATLGSSDERNGDADGVGDGCLARGAGRHFELGANQVLTITAWSGLEHGDGDDHGGGQNDCRRTRQ